jgi:hypothetical protein
MTTRAKNWSFAMLAVLALTGAVAYWVYSQPRTYAYFTHYPDTGLVTNDYFGQLAWGYGERPGHQTLVITRGEDNTHSDLWHHESLFIEFDAPLVVGRTNLGEKGVRLGYSVAAFFVAQQGIEKQGVRGWIDIESVDGTSSVARYDIAFQRLGATQEVRFEGRASFVRQPRPEESRWAAKGMLFPE